MPTQADLDQLNAELLLISAQKLLKCAEELAKILEIMDCEMQMMESVTSPPEWIARMIKDLRRRSHSLMAGLQNIPDGKIQEVLAVSSCEYAAIDEGVRQLGQAYAFTAV